MNETLRQRIVAGRQSVDVHALNRDARFLWLFVQTHGAQDNVMKLAQLDSSSSALK